MLTIFSAPKAFADEHIGRIQRNALRSWVGLGNGVEVLLLGDEPGIREAAENLRIRNIPIRSRSKSGAPLINELFVLARQHAKFDTLCYVNADIILLEDFLPSVQVVRKKFSTFLIVGNRYDLEFEDELSLQDDWRAGLRQMVREVGKLHPPMGSDYFIYRSGQFTHIPSFALGRAGWDNWMMYMARHMGIPLVDASTVITAIHQEHDYGHLPGGEPHYRHPESNLNIELAGGHEMMFRLRDANWIFTPAGVRQKRLNEWEWPRKIEADLIARLGAGFMARLTRMIFHPGAALAYIQHKIRQSLNARSESSDDQETLT